MKDQSITYGNITVDIIYDDSPENPRMDTNLTQFVMFHKLFKLPNETGISNYNEFFNSWSEMQLDLQSKFKHVISVYMLHHGDIYFSLSDFMDKWDSGQVGFIVSNDESIEDFRKVAQSELNTYGYYARGECYGFTVNESEIEDTESVWSFYGSDHHESGLIESLYSVLKHSFAQNPKAIEEIVKQLN
jgi:hypothetical protein